MADCMEFPKTVEKFMESYKVVDTEGIYMSSGCELVPIFRMKQWFEHLPTIEKRKKGEWAFVGYNMYECSSCGVVYTSQELDAWRTKNYDPAHPNFCPKCGADMRGEEG